MLADCMVNGDRGARRVGVGRRGFTLVEALVAMTLSAILIGLVTSVFMAQSDFFEDVVRRSSVHDAMRSVVDLVAGDVRSVSDGGFVVATASRLVVRSPVSVGMTCLVQGANAHVYLPSSSAGLDSLSVTGYGIRESDGTWAYYDDAWGDIPYQIGSTPKGNCADIGMDTLGIPDSHFLRLTGPGNDPTPAPATGEGFMLFQELELELADSQLEPSTTGLYRGTNGGALVEFASGLGENASFAYRVRGSDTFAGSVTGGARDSINAIRITAHGVSPVRLSGGDGGYEFTLTRDVPTRNEAF